MAASGDSPGPTATPWPRGWFSARWAPGQVGRVPAAPRPLPRLTLDSLAPLFRPTRAPPHPVPSPPSWSARRAAGGRRQAPPRVAQRGGSGGGGSAETSPRSWRRPGECGARAAQAGAAAGARAGVRPPPTPARQASRPAPADLGRTRLAGSRAGAARGKGSAPLVVVSARPLAAPRPGRPIVSRESGETPRARRLPGSWWDCGPAGLALL